MTISGRARGMLRLIAVAMTCVLVLSAFVSTLAHASHNAVDHTTVTTSADHTALLDTDGNDYSVHHHHVPSNTADHAACADLVCHGGSSIVGSVAAAIVPARRGSCICIVDDIATDTGGQSLERPPSIAVLV